MKKVFIWLSMLAMGGTVANAAVVLQLGLNDRDKSSLTWEFSNLDADVVLNGGKLVNGVILAENTLNGATGSFSVTLSAAQKIDPLDPMIWSFGPTTATIYGWSNMGWGVCSAGDFRGLLRLNPGEAFLLRFDISNLSLSAGNALVFSVLIDDERSCRIYRRIGRASGMLAGSISTTHSGFSPLVMVNDSVEFAITDAGHEDGVATFIKEFSFDVVSETELESLPIAKPVVSEKRVRGYVPANNEESKSSPVLASEEVSEEVNVTAPPETIDDAESPMSVTQLAIVFVVCIIILIPGIMVVVKVLG